jgi:hypothetical protein
MQLATARLEWILRETRRELSGRFTSEEFWALLECYQGTVFFPDLFYSLASDLCDDCGVDLDAYETSSIAPLVSKLLALTPCQRATLADALEQAWYRGMQSCKSPETIFSSLGIKLL